ncbi:Histone-lysine N-methyltransferase SETMAR-like [Oopsacas minuta]|uniref:Histone-lysine N-methyltransferase SETMAR-like n=1 Tax=Oopsacas minuta TaxID=111878 RepID=A0AAV7K4F2_9METZ|nr:Histone-lysine N-methyltransferase SETMAR-like [Oopsacas minuta]
MATVFWDREGIIYLDCLPEKTTINSDYYVDELKKLCQAIKRERRGKLTRGILLQYDNARPHVSSKTIAGIDDLGFECLPHPPYCPDFAPSDYWLFGEMKRPLGGKRFEDFKWLEYEIKQWEKGIPKEFYTTGLEKLPERWKRCIS